MFLNYHYLFNLVYKYSLNYMQFINLISSMKMLETKILDFYMVYLLKKLYMVYGLNC